jgi:cation transport regulator ChaC
MDVRPRVFATPAVAEPTFDYFAYGSCMCPVDLQRTLGEPTYPYAVGPALLEGYRLAFSRRSPIRNCGVLDVVRDRAHQVYGVLYRLPLRLSGLLDEREEVPQGGYRRETISVTCGGQRYGPVRTYTVVNKLTVELAPNDWYLTTVLRGAATCGLPEDYYWQLFERMHALQRQQRSPIAPPHPSLSPLPCAAVSPRSRRAA